MNEEKYIKVNWEKASSCDFHYLFLIHGPGITKTKIAVIVYCIDITNGSHYYQAKIEDSYLQCRVNSVAEGKEWIEKILGVNKV